MGLNQGGGRWDNTTTQGCIEIGHLVSMTELPNFSVRQPQDFSTPRFEVTPWVNNGIANGYFCIEFGFWILELWRRCT
jgi:hypothetical protein